VILKRKYSEIATFINITEILYFVLIKSSVGFVFITKDGRKEVREPIGTNLLDAAHKNNIDLEG
jgi:hypothetical protein